MFGDMRLQDILLGLDSKGIDDIKSDILSALEEYECSDDVTFMLIRRANQ